MTAKGQNSCVNVKAVVIDNYDSFVFNLVDELLRRDCEVEVWRNNISVSFALQRLAAHQGPKLLVLSPGPGAPASAGCSIDLVRSAPREIAVFGVCLGHQAIVEAFGGEIGPAKEIVHGKASAICHTQRGIFAGLESPLKVGRYHSLTARQVPDELTVSAWLDDEPMAVEHRKHSIYGVQFHPESILSPAGGILIDNVIGRARGIGSDVQDLSSTGLGS